MAQFNYGDLRETALPRYIIDEDGVVLGSAANPNQVSEPCWQYLGGTALTLDGTNDQQVVLPVGTTAFYLRARGGEVYYNINGNNCDANAPGYIPEDGSDGTGKLCDFVRLAIFSATAATVAHLQFFSGG